MILGIRIVYSKVVTHKYSSYHEHSIRTFNFKKDNFDSYSWERRACDRQAVEFTTVNCGSNTI